MEFFLVFDKYPTESDIKGLIDATGKTPCKVAIPLILEEKYL